MDATKINITKGKIFSLLISINISSCSVQTLQRKKLFSYIGLFEMKLFK